VRLRPQSLAFLLAIFCLASTCAQSAAAQADPGLLPEESAAKAKSLVRQVIATLGGPTYLNVHDTDCSARLAQFGHSGELMGFTPFRDMWVLPAKNRVEYLAKGEHNFLGFLINSDELMISHGGVLITVFDGDKGWMLDKAGVSEQPEDITQAFSEAVKSSMNYMLRQHINDEGVELRYLGVDIVDLKEAEWIEFTDRDHRDLRMALEKNTHLPLRWVVAKRDPETRETTETVTSYMQYIPVDGVLTPLNVTRAQNGRQISQMYYTGCKYNTSLSPDLFSRTSLEQRSAEVTKKGYKNSKDKN
jgi:hypothetical protein